MPYVQRDDALVFFDQTGSGIPVITTHGFIENGSYWGRTGVSAALARAGFRVIDMDLRGHGRSVARAGAVDHSVEAVVEDIGAVADALGLGRFHLLTHATGGMAGVRYAIAHHHRLLSLVSTDTAAATIAIAKYATPEWDEREVPPWRGEFPATAALAQMLRQAGSFHRIMADLRADPQSHALGPFFNRFAANPDPERCWRWTEQIYAANDPYACAEFAAGFFRDTDARVRGMRQIGCPALVVVGEHDVLLRAGSEQIARNIPGARLAVLPGLGHMIAIEDPEQTVATILPFLRQATESAKG